MPGKPEPGQFGVRATNDVGGWLIRVGTRSTVNHACICTSPGVIVEADQPQVIRRRLRAEATQWIWSDVALTDDQRDSIIREAASMIGLKYGWLDVICCALAILGVRWRRALDRIHNPNTVDCSHLVTRAYKQAGIDLIPGKPEYLESPGDLLDVIRHKTAPEWR